MSAGASTGRRLQGALRRVGRLTSPRSASPAVAPAAAAPPEPAGPSPALISQRDQLTERFALLQSELGGLFYEMAIRDHVRMDVLIERAAALQRIDTELGNVEHLIAHGGGAAGNCPACGTPHARGAAFCSQCAAALVS